MAPNTSRGMQSLSRVMRKLEHQVSLQYVGARRSIGSSGVLARLKASQVCFVGRC
jgi:hypothetical protein